MDATASVGVFIGIVQKCFCIIIYRHICYNVVLYRFGFFLKLSF